MIYFLFSFFCLRKRFAGVLFAYTLPIHITRNKRRLLAGWGCRDRLHWSCSLFPLLLLTSLPSKEGEVRSMVVLRDRSVVWIQIKQINSRRGVQKPKHLLRASRFRERFWFRCETSPPPPWLSPRIPSQQPPSLLDSLRRGISPLPLISSPPFAWESANVHLRQALWLFCSSPPHT